jgi:hypothetical protein
MIFFTVSNLSHIHHYLRFCELNKEKVIPFTLSDEVINFFKRHKIKTVSQKTLKINSVLGKNELNKIITYLERRININDQFIFLERLMTNEILYIVKKIAKNKNVMCYEDCFVTKGYKETKLSEHSIRDIILIIKYFLIFRIRLKCFWSHDQKCLGVDIAKLNSWGVKVNKQYIGRNDYFFDHKAKWIFKFKEKLNEPRLKKRTNPSRIIFVIGYSIDEECKFYDISLRRNLINALINEFGDKLKIKYSPRAKKFEFQGSRLINNKLMLEEICSNNDILISDYSTSLITCANIGLPTISILGMAEVIDEKLFKFWKQWLTKRNFKYPLFPNTLERLIYYIRKHNRKHQSA